MKSHSSREVLIILKADCWYEAIQLVAITNLSIPLRRGVAL